MKVAVAGATGVVGQGIVRACLDDERITKMVVLTRRHLATEVEESPKTEIIIHEDFSQYPTEVMENLHGVDACLWAVGGRVDQFGGDKDMARKVGVDYTLAGAQAMHDHLPAHVEGDKKFRFVFCSGMMAEWDQDRPLYFLNDTRKIKGSAEKGLCEMADGDGEAGRFEVWIARPSKVVPIKPSVSDRVSGALSGGISAVQLGKAMITMAVDGYTKRIAEAGDLAKMY